MSNTINAQGRAQLGGIAQIFFVEHRLVQRWPVVRAGKLTSAHVLATGASFAQFIPTAYTPALNADGTDSDQGTSYAQVLEGFYAGTDDAVSSQFSRMQGKRYLVLLRYFNGTIVAVGELLAGLLFTTKYNSGMKPGERKGYTWHFQADTTAPAPYVTAAFNVDGLGIVTPGQGMPSSPTGPYVTIRTGSGRVLGTAVNGQVITITSAFDVTISVS